jgi:hypothetical protein
MMIAKHVPMNAAKKSDFSELVMYLTGPQGKHERVGLVRVTNCHSEQAEIAMLEVLNTQAQNTRATADKTYHLIVSFRAGEAPDEATLKAIEERLCGGLGFADHQRVSVVHHDTDNLHVHVAINKIHPTRYTIHEPFNAYHTLGQLCDKLENDYRLEKDNHKANKVGSENRAADMECHAAVESLLGWIKRECKDQIQGARSWAEMHQVMHEHGLRIHERGNGLVITSENGVSVKASSVGRELSKAKLEERLGGFKPSLEPVQGKKPDKRYDKQPVRSRISTVELYARYKAAQQLATTTRTAEWSMAIARKKRLIEDAKRDARLKRATIKLIRAPGLGKKLMYAAISKKLRAEIGAVNQQYIKERQEIYEKHKRRTWADWLCSEAMAGDQEALAALRARDVATGLKGNTVGGQGSPKGRAVGAKHDSITKKGTVIYRVGASVVRDDGDKLKVSRGADQAGLEAALRMAMERYGSCIAVNGSAAFKEKVAQAAAAAKLSVSFDDDALERRRQQLAQAVIIKESKYGNARSTDGCTVRRRPDRSRDGGGRQATGNRAPEARAGAAAPVHGHRAAHRGKPDARSAGQAPPPEAHHNLRGLSELGVVHLADRGEVLLPGHVPGHVEHQGTEPDHGVRRDVHRVEQSAPAGRTPKAVKVNAAALATRPKVGPVGNAPPPASKDRLRSLSQLGTIVIGEADSGARAEPMPGPATPGVAKREMVELEHELPGQAAADTYITEREQKRSKGFDIPKHTRYTFTKDGAVEYAGIRQIEGQPLALLKLGEEIMVLPVDAATAKRLKRMAVGQQVGLTAKGAIKTKGRGR